MNLHYRATVGQKSYISVPHRKTQIFPPCWTDTSNHDVVWRGLFSCTSRTPSKCCSGQTSGQTSVGLSEEPINRGRSLTSAAHSPDSPGATHPLRQDAFCVFQLSLQYCNHKQADTESSQDGLRLCDSGFSETFSPTSSTLILLTGTPQGCVLSSFLFTHDGSATTHINIVMKFMDDTTVVGLILDYEDREEIQHLIGCC